IVKRKDTTISHHRRRIVTVCLLVSIALPGAAGFGQERVPSRAEPAAAYFPMDRSAGGTAAGTFIYSFQCAPTEISKPFTAEPEAGSWRPFILQDIKSSTLPPPPAPGSAQEQAEIAELKAIVNSRSPQALAQAQFWATGPASFRWVEKAFECGIKY